VKREERSLAGHVSRFTRLAPRSSPPPKRALAQSSPRRHILPGLQLNLSLPLRILVAITGASGALYAQRLLDNLDPANHEIHVVLSAYAHAVMSEELPDGLRLPPGVTSYHLKSMNAPFASGSNPPDAMVIIPCTMGTLGRIAHGYSEDVLLRAADVVLKEKRKLILVPRETPLNLVHVKNFELLILAGATILPANPTFYTRPQTVEAVVDTVVARVLDHLGVQHGLMARWGAEEE
jgi:4-hydroxy-3-polyprenylbenzoate decarboxylase